MDNIFEALNTIKEVCSNNGNCNTCPFYIKNTTIHHCGIKNCTPSCWDIQQPKNRYFKED